MHGHLLEDIGVAIIAAGLIGLPAYLLGAPLILAYLVAGVVLGPHLGLGIIKNSDSIANLSEIGLVLLLFILGLEINLKKLLMAGKGVVLGGAIQISGCLVLGYAYYSLLGFHSTNQSLTYLVVASALSSTLVVVKILSDKMDLDSLASRITLGILVVQDVFAIAFLAVQPNLNNLNLLAILLSITKVAGLGTLSWVLARYILPNIFRRAGRQPELMLILAMGWCFLMCGAANYLSLSLEMGALIAGISIATFPYHMDVAAKISSLRDFFITLFFVSLGLQIPSPSLDVLYLTVAIISFALVSRVLTIFPALYLLGYANRASLLPAINLSQISEFSLVVATLGLAYKHIEAPVLQAFVLALVVTALISSYLIPGAQLIYVKLNKVLQGIGFKDGTTSSTEHSESTPTPPPEVVLLGFYREASSLLHELRSRNSQSFMDKILVVDFNPEVHHELKKQGIRCQYGDIANIDTLRSLPLSDSQVIICTISDRILRGTTNLKLLRHLKQLAPKACVVVTAESTPSAHELYDEGANFVFLPRITGAVYLVDVLERLQVNGYDSIRSDAHDFIRNRHEIIP